MDIDELRTVQTKERQKDSLQHLRDSFYEDVAAYVADLKQRRQAAADASSDPFADPDVSRLTDEIEAAEDVVEAVYERRVGKVVKLASFAAAEMPVDEEGLTVQERDLFEDLVGRINENTDRVLDILAGEGDTGPGPSGANLVHAAPGSEPAPEETQTPEQLADNQNGEPSESSSTADAEASPSRSEPAVGTGADEQPTESADDDAPPAPPQAPEGEQITDGEDVRDDAPVADDARAAEADEESDSVGRPDGGTTAGRSGDPRTTVRITADVGSLLGMDDREYDLRSEDVVSLPDENADALVQREAATEL